jgi:predicted ATPase
MLTRLKVSGFKNLVDLDVRFGPFTCIAGANGVGKSNLFDAIHFLSALADHPLIEAAKSVRDESGKAADVRSLFHRVGDHYEEQMSFEAEMIIPGQGVDDLGQAADASITFLRYVVVLAYRKGENGGTPGAMELLKEELSHIKIGEASRCLLFPHNPRWRNSAVRGKRFVPYFISTKGEGADRVIELHQDKGTGGRPQRRSAAKLPRTVLSAVNAAESPTALLARREMRSWRLLQLEPSSLRKPDEFTAPPRLGMDGSHLPATLDRLSRAQSAGADGGPNAAAGYDVCGQVASRLAELIEDVCDVSVDRDDKRELLTLMVTDLDHTPLPARALSDGTLRFLALAVLEMDPEAQGLLCLEEPENGIHPERIPAMLNLLQSIAVDTNEPVGPDNPLRQVIINTHSPVVVGEVQDESLLVAELREAVRGNKRFKKVCFGCLPDTWRQTMAFPDETPTVVSQGVLLQYLNPHIPSYSLRDCDEKGSRGRKVGGRRAKSCRVVDRADFMPLLDGVMGKQ